MRLAGYDGPAQPVILGDRDLLAERAEAIGLNVAFRDFRPENPVDRGSSRRVAHSACRWRSTAGQLESGQRPLRSGAARPRAGWLPFRRVRGDGHGAGAQGRDQRRRHPFHRPYRISRREDRHAARRHDAGRQHRRGAARGAGHHASAPEGRAGSDHAGIAGADAAHPARRSAREVRHCADPRILVAGLNPHAGEGGHLGMEEIEVITPVLDKLRAEGMQLSRPHAGRHPVHAARCWPVAMPCWPCTTTRVCPCSSTPPSATASTSRSACRSSAPRSITARRSNWPAAARADPGSLFAAVNGRSGAHGRQQELQRQMKGPSSPASASARISWSIAASSTPSSRPSRRNAATPWSKSAPAWAR